MKIDGERPVADVEVSVSTTENERKEERGECV